MTLLLASATTSRAARAVEGGAVDRATTHAVAIGTGPEAAGTLLCSGTLVSARVVLTVRHCVSPITDTTCPGSFGEATRAASDLWVESAPYVDPPTSRRRVSSWSFPKASAVCGADVALLVLDEPVPETDATPAVPVVSAASFAEATTSPVFGLAGYGASGAGRGDAGQRRSRFDVRRQCVVGDARFPCPAGSLLGDGELTSLDGACPGDSGAGALRADAPDVVFAVLSRGELEDGCGRGIYVRTDRWAWLVGRTVLEAAPRAEDAPAWARALFPVPAPPGAFCRRDADCAGRAACISRDEERSFACVARCASAADCADGETCQAELCAASARPAQEDHGCRGARGDVDAATGLLGLLAVVWVRGARRRARPA